MQSVNIAGGGVAGLALGLALRQSGVPVTVFEAGSYPRHRLCGEFISGAGPRVFDQLGLTEVFRDSERLTDTAWFCGDRLVIRRALPEPACGISRWKLDAAMAARLTELGGEVRCGQRISQPPSEEGWVMATGRSRADNSPWIGQKSHYREFQPAADLEMHLGRGGYAGIARIENGLVNVCALLPAAAGRVPGATLPDRLRFVGLTALARRLDAAEPVEVSRSGISHFLTGWQPDVPGRVAIGDHRAIIPPFTGHGLSMAMTGALEIAPPLAAWSAGALTWSEATAWITESVRQKFRSRLRWASWLHPFLLRPAGHAAMRLLGGCGLLPWRWLYQKVR